METTTRHIFEVVGRTQGVRDLKKELASLNTASAMSGAQVGKAVQVLNKQTTTFTKNGQQLQKVTTLWKDQGGAIHKTTRLMDSASKGSAMYGQSVKTTANAMKSSTGIMKQFGTALKRVLIVVPIWTLFRSIMRGVFSTLRNGAKDWVDFDKAMLQSKAVIHDSGMAMGESLKVLEDRIESLSLKSGVAMAKISKAFFRFGTLGVDFEASMAGAEGSLNVALALGGDLETTAKTLGMSYRLLGDSLDSSLSDAQQWELIGAKLFKVWKINAFEMNEFSSSLRNFVGTANVVNLSLDETIALLTSLSTAGLKAGIGGRTLTTAFEKFFQNMEKLPDTLGIIPGATETTMSILIRTLARLKEQAEKTGGGLDDANLTGKISDLFGGVRSTKSIKGLLSVFDVLIQNLDTTGLKYGEAGEIIAEYLERNKDVENSLGRQVEIHKNLKTQVGKAFIKGLVGGDNFNESLKRINKTLKNSNSFFEKFGDTLTKSIPSNIAFDALTWAIENSAKASLVLHKNLDNALNGKGTIEEIKKIKNSLLLLSNLPGVSFDIDVKSVSKTLDMIIAKKEEDPNFSIKVPVKITGKEKVEEDLNSIMHKMDAFMEAPEWSMLDTATRSRLLRLKEELAIVDAEATGYSKIESSMKRLVNRTSEYVDKFNKTKDVVDGTTFSLNKVSVITQVLAKDWDSILESTNNQVIGQKEILEIATLLNKVEKERLKTASIITNALIKNELEILKINGANTRQILEARIEYEKLAGIGQDEVSLLKNKLSLEQELTKEKLNQTKLSSDSIKLYKVAQKYGTEVAVEISKVLAGQTTFDDFEREGGRKLKALKENWESLYTDKKATKFFEGYEGRQIITPEKRATQAVADRRFDLAERLPNAPQFDQILKVGIDKISFDINIDTIKVKNDIMDAILKALDNPASDIIKAIQKEIGNY